MKPRRLPFAAALFALTIFAGAACSSSTPPSSGHSGSSSLPGATASPATSATVRIHDFTFDPSVLTVRAGAKVTFVNNDDTTHTATAKDKSFDTGDLGHDGRKTVTLTKVGTIHYICSIHNYMTGTIRVVAG